MSPYRQDIRDAEAAEYPYSYLARMLQLMAMGRSSVGKAEVPTLLPSTHLTASASSLVMAVLVLKVPKHARKLCVASLRHRDVFQQRHGPGG